MQYVQNGEYIYFFTIPNTANVIGLNQYNLETGKYEEGIRKFEFDPKEGNEVWTVAFCKRLTHKYQCLKDQDQFLNS